jgi:predicted kinase
MNKKPKIVILSGLPASGKSTYRKREEFKDFTHVSSDDFIEFYAKSRNLKYDDVFEDVITYSKTYANMLFEDAKLKRKDIIVDMTNLTLKSRKKWLSRVGNSYTSKLVYFNVPIEEIYRRLDLREKETGKHIPKNVIEKMVSFQTEPDMSLELFDEFLEIT